MKGEKNVEGRYNMGKSPLATFVRGLGWLDTNADGSVVGKLAGKSTAVEPCRPC